MVSLGLMRFCSFACRTIAAVRCVNAFIMSGSSAVERVKLAFPP